MLKEGNSMGMYTSTPVVSLLLKNNAAEDAEPVTVEIGSAVEMTVTSPCKEPTTYSGTVVGISLARRSAPPKNCIIYDGIPTNQYQTDDIAGLHNAADYFMGERIALKLEDETIRIVPIGAIMEITATAPTTE